MTLKAQIIIAILTIIAFIFLINMVRKHQLELRYALSWLFVGFAILLLDCFPNIMEKLTSALGMASPVNMIFFFGFCFVLMLVFVLTYSMSRMSNRIKELSQEIALLEKNIKENKMNGKDIL